LKGPNVLVAKKRRRALDPPSLTPVPRGCATSAVTSSQGSPTVYTAVISEMQAPTIDNEEKIKSFRSTVSEPRFARYLTETKGDQAAAINLYHWNTELCKSFYTSLQMWEVALRNRLNTFLCWKFNSRWPYDSQRAIRQMTLNDRRKVEESITRQRQLRGIQSVPTDAVVADLSAGFWVSLLNKSYDVPFVWRHNLSRIFPGEKTITRDEASRLCDGLLDLRNRVAHHEPIYHLPLTDRRNELSRLLAAMCPTTNGYVAASCTFLTIWNDPPQRS
jgi:Abi-like protein